MDPAQQVQWWRDLEPVAEAMGPPLIESEELDPLLSTSEKPLVHLEQPELEQKLPEILEKSNPEH
jgi:hypothetical protein